MVEQMVSESEVIWLRFGRAWTTLQNIVTSIIWEPPFSSPVIKFKLSYFEEAYSSLKSLDEAWNSTI